MFVSNHSSIGGAKGWHDSYLHSEGICMFGCSGQMTQTSSVPVSLLEPRLHF